MRFPISRGSCLGGTGGSDSATSAWMALSDEKRDAVTGVFVNVGKAIAAYERRIELGPSRFDRYVDAITNDKPGDGILTNDEIAGLKLFIGKANCTQCHNGPLLTNNEFHNTGVPRRAELPIDDGRLTGAAAVLSDEFNCRSRWSDARESCAELDYLVTGDHSLERAYKVPSLRNVAGRAPYMNAGQFATLRQVLDHYNRAPAAPKGHTELRPLAPEGRGTAAARSVSSDTDGTGHRQRNGTAWTAAMTRTVDVVIVGGNAAAIAATIDAVRRGLRVLVVIRRRRSRVAWRLRHAIGAAGLAPQHLTVVTGAEVACVDGVKSVEAVVVRQLRTGRLIGVNASTLVAFGRSARSCSSHRRCASWAQDTGSIPQQETGFCV